MLHVSTACICSWSTYSAVIVSTILAEGNSAASPFDLQPEFTSAMNPPLFNLVKSKSVKDNKLSTALYIQ